MNAREQGSAAKAGRQSKAGGDATTCLMIETLESGLSRLYEGPIHIRRLNREPCMYTSSFHAERVRVFLNTGKVLRVFFKDLNPRHQIQPAQRVRKLDLAPSYRELQVYRSILSPERLGSPQLYAARWEPTLGVYWLFLEDAGALPLNLCGNFARWVLAVQWAARFHAATRSLPESRIGFLPQYERDGYWQCAERIEKILPDLDSPDRELIRKALDRFVGCIDGIAGLPHSVIHGQFFGRNIMLRIRNPERLIAVIDWETAAIGPSAFDVVSLTSGKWTDQQRLAMWRAYFHEYQAATGLRLGWESFQQGLCEIELYQNLEWLAWWRNREFSPQFGTWMKELERITRTHPAVAAQ
jgi:hypothetical protein